MELGANEHAITNAQHAIPSLVLFDG